MGRGSRLGLGGASAEQAGEEALLFLGGLAGGGGLAAQGLGAAAVLGEEVLGEEVLGEEVAGEGALVFGGEIVEPDVLAVLGGEFVAEAGEEGGGGEKLVDQGRRGAWGALGWRPLAGPAPQAGGVRRRVGGGARRGGRIFVLGWIVAGPERWALGRRGAVAWLVGRDIMRRELAGDAALLVWGEGVEVVAAGRHGLGEGGAGFGGGEELVDQFVGDGGGVEGGGGFGGVRHLRCSCAHHCAALRSAFRLVACNRLIPGRDLTFPETPDQPAARRGRIVQVTI